MMYKIWKTGEPRYYVEADTMDDAFFHKIRPLDKNVTTAQACTYDEEQYIKQNGIKTGFFYRLGGKQI